MNSRRKQKQWSIKSNRVEEWWMERILLWINSERGAPCLHLKQYTSMYWEDKLLINIISVKEFIINYQIFIFEFFFCLWSKKGNWFKREITPCSILNRFWFAQMMNVVYIFIDTNTLIKIIVVNENEHRKPVSKL